MPLSFPSQNHRYTDEREIPNRLATSLGLSNRSFSIELPLTRFALPLTRIVKVPGTKGSLCHESLFFAGKIRQVKTGAAWRLSQREFVLTGNGPSAGL
jgi:hypothetical protein